MIKKKLLILISIPVLSLIILLVFAGNRSLKADFGEDFQTNGTILTKYNGTDSFVLVPQGITKIAPECFANNPLIESVEISETVRSIERDAFSNCINLKSVTIADSVETIGETVFSGCTSLSTVNFGNDLYSIGSGVFSGCSNLQEVSVSPENKFFACENGAIYNSEKSKLYSYLPGYPAENYSMPNEVKSVSRYAFFGANNLKSITTSNALKEINDYAFYNMANLKSVTINKPTNKINMGAFQSCPQLEQVIMPESIINIYGSSFDSNNEALTFICEENSYAYNFALQNNIKVANDKIIADKYESNVNANNTSDNNTVINSDSASSNQNNNSIPPQEDLENNISKAEQYYNNVIQSGLGVGGTTVVSDKAFIMIGDLVVNNGDFNNASSTNDSNINANKDSVILKSIDDYAFYNSGIESYNFQDVNLNNLAVIGKLSFARNKLNRIDIPEGIKTIELGAFYHCDNLQDVAIPNTVTNIEAYAFEYTPFMNNFLNSGEKYLIVGDGVLLRYNGSDENVIIPDNVKYIAANAFKDNASIKTITFSDNLISINPYGFNNCSNLSETINLNTNAVNDNSFYGCDL